MGILFKYLDADGGLKMLTNSNLQFTNAAELKIDQGDRSLISYFERGREFGVRATSEVSHGDRYLGMTAAMTQAPVLEIHTAILCINRTN